MTKFQAIVLAFFVLCIVVGVAVFATFKGSGGSENQYPSITIWGTFPQEAFDSYVGKVNLSLSSQLSVVYVQKNRSTFSQEFIAALARGQGPDAILIPADMLLPHLDKITPIPYSALPQRDYMNTYIQEGEIYLSPNGVYGLPFVVDPMVMYWNRDVFSSKGIPSFPKTWDEFSGLIKKINEQDQNGNIRKTAIALGDFTNIVNAREILASIILQTGNNITVGTGNSYESALKHEPSPQAAIQFFAQFVDPNNKNYSWNRSMTDSKTAFLAGNLATYFGFASEVNDIKNKNPNLNFDVAPLPQIKTGGLKSLYGKMYGFSIVRTSSKQNAVYQILSILNAPSNLAGLTSIVYLPTVRRDLITAGSTDPYISVFNEQALVAKTWFDADPTVSYNIFGGMINSITSGAKSLGDAIRDASDQYDVALKQAVQ